MSAEALATHFRYDPDRLVTSFYVGCDRTGGSIVLKLALRSGRSETIHLDRSTAAWLFGHLDDAITSGRIVDRRVRRGEKIDEEAPVAGFLKDQPDLGSEDWDNLEGRRTARGIEVHECVDGLGMALTTDLFGCVSYTLPDQLALYLAEYLRDDSTHVGNRHLITFRDIEERTEAFLAYMEAIDRRLRGAGVSIPGRPILAFRELARDGLQIALPSELSRPILDWFEARYGTRLSVDWSIGRSILLIRGDPYVLRFPRIYGRFNGIVDVTAIAEGFTKELFAALSDDERTILVNLFVRQYECFRYIDLLAEDLKSSIDSAVFRVVGTNRHFGESKWASLQFVEKLLKQFIGKHENPSHHHDLRRLASRGQQLGCGEVPEYLIRNIQCDAGVRYGESRVTVAQAVAALHAAIKVGRIMAPFVTDGVPLTTQLG